MGRHRLLPSDRLLVAGLAVVAAVVYWLAVDLFPYHSVNDDEGVYLTQAAMLLEGRLYVLNEGSAARFRALDATGDRRPYRFTYRGEWRGAADPVDPTVTPLSVAAGERVTATATFGVPTGMPRAHARVVTETGSVRYDVGRVDDAVTLELAVGAAGVRLRTLPPDGTAETAAPSAPLPAGASEAVVLLTFVEPRGTNVTYRQLVTVERRGGTVRVVWPPETRVCSGTTDCAPETTYVGPDADYLAGVTVRTGNATSR